MSRLVIARPRALSATGTQDTAKDKLERVAKYIPGEIIASYLFLNGISASAVSSSERMLWYGIAFIVCLGFTPFYFHLMAQPGDALRTQQYISSAAFVVWAYSLGAGLFQEAGLY